MYVYGFKKNNRTSYILVDAGVAFPKMDVEPGVDLIFPNPQLILDNLRDLEGIFITHAHEDHLGAIGVWRFHCRPQNVQIPGALLCF